MLKTYKFQDLVSKTPKIRGIKTNGYKDTGKYPVIDQGNKFISGYSDNEEVLYKDSLPVVVFGDHTLAVKFVDFPFCVGADGTQILKPNDEVVTGKFLYYSIINLNIKSLGYSRHFKVLKEATFQIPTIEEQKHIVKILDKADALRQKRKQAIGLLDDYLKSVFLKMFGDSVESRNITIGEALLHKILLLHKDGNHGGNYPKKEEFGLKGVPFITAKSIDESGHLILNKIEYLSEKKANKLTIGWIKTDDILLAHNATVGRVGYYPGTFEKALIGTSLTAFRANKEFINPHYLFEYLRSDYFQKQLFKGMGQSTRNQVPITAQRNLKLIIPPLSLQYQFSGIVKKSENIKHNMLIQFTEIESQFQALMQKSI